MGSPPHTWRILLKLERDGWGVGITSTYVENTGKSDNVKSVIWDHLHIRGEYTK